METHSKVSPVVITCALTGVLTDPEVHRVPVTPKEMAEAAFEAFQAGATVVHCHFRSQEKGKQHLPTWDVNTALEIVAAIRERVPGILINMSTGVFGPDISGPVACLREVKPEIAALNSGSLNYLKLKADGEWAWAPVLFDNPVEKIERFLKAMAETGVIPECECFDSGIVRSIGLFEKRGLLKSPPFISLVMGVASGMPADPDWLPLLVREINPKAHWQVIAIGRKEVWDLHLRALELGGHIRTGLEDTFYLPNGKKTESNCELVEAAASLVKSCGRKIATLSEARKIYAIA